MTNNKLFLITLILIFSFYGCKKSNLNSSSTTISKNKNTPPKGFFIENKKLPGVVSDENIKLTTSTANAATNSFDPNNGDIPIILGQHLPNPYSVTNMQNAVNTLYGINYPISATHLYVRFKPVDNDQLITLEETENLELQDYPMDYEILQDGDFYDDPNLSTEELPWLYTVVEVGYTSPQGFQMEILEYLYLPENNELLEDMAESMTLGAQYTSWVNSTSTNITQLNTITIRRTDVNVDDFDFQPDPCYCDPTTVCTINPMCEGGGGGGVFGGGGQSDYGIFVEEQTVCNQQSRIVPLRHVAVVAKRWFKFWRGYTNNSGQFTVNKTFRNKVKVIVKTKNEHAIISKVRGIRLWQMLLPCRKRIGIFNGNELLTIRHVFTKPADGDAHNKELTYWAAATTHNSVIEFKDYTTEFNLRQPPDNLRIMVTNWGFMENAAATPMWNKCHNDIIPNYFAEFFISSGSYIGPGTTLLANTLKNRMDIIIGYKSTDYTCMLTSSQLRSTVYHEMGHAQHFSQVGCNFWADYRNAIATELSKLNQTNVHPYGTGSDQSTAPIIATGEMWGNHCEKWYSERHYGNGGGVAANFISRLQSLVFGNDATSGLNANYWAIENFNPNRIQDVHRWIPQGLPYDLFDNRNDNINLIIDNANGFTINLCFNALQSDVRSIPLHLETGYYFKMLMPNKEQ